MDDDKFDIDDVPDEQELPPLELLTRADFLESTHVDNNPIEDLRWVFHALGADGLKKEDAPSPGAWNLLGQLRRDEMLLKAFYGTVYPKLLPTKAQMERGDDRAEDGRKIFGLIDGLLLEPRDAAPVLSGTEKRARELALSPTGS